MDKSNASVVSLDPPFLNHLLDQLVLAVSEAAHKFRLSPHFHPELQVANAVEAWLAVNVDPIIGVIRKVAMLRLAWWLASGSTGRTFVSNTPRAD